MIDRSPSKVVGNKIVGNRNVAKRSEDVKHPIRHPPGNTKRGPERAWFNAPRTPLTETEPVATFPGSSGAEPGRSGTRS